jgi:hypothetical protein
MDVKRITPKPKPMAMLVNEAVPKVVAMMTPSVKQIADNDSRSVV